MTDKRKQIIFCIERIHEILDMLQPENKWIICYGTAKDIQVSKWNKEYLHIVDGEEYFFIYIDGTLVYAVNITGDSVLTAVKELVDKLAAKF